MRNIERFDPRLPAALCRAAWQLRDGQVSAPFESPYGTHMVKRISAIQLRMVLFTEAIKPQIAAQWRRELQEDLVFALRKRLSLKLRY